jgi:putative transposase
MNFQIILHVLEMKYDPHKHHRKSIRIPQYDYAQPGAYFITICTHRRECLFGEIVDGAMRLNEYGTIVMDQWHQTAILRPRIRLDAFVVMPNHVHGILMISDQPNDVDMAIPGRGTLQCAPTNAPQTHERFGKSTSDSIPTIVKLFKSSVTVGINTLRQTRGIPVWQRGYHEHVIRDENSLERIREYIANNPFQWTLDENHPDHFTSVTWPLSADPLLLPSPASSFQESP